MDQMKIEMVQIRLQPPHRFHCRCLSLSGKPAQSVTDTLESALEFIVPLVTDAHIRLFTLQGVSLNPESTLILAALRPSHIRQLSMVSVSLAEIAPRDFHQLVCGPLKADTYSFNGMRCVDAAHFNDELVEEDAMMGVKSLEIDIMDFQQHTLPCAAIFDRTLLHWFFDGPDTGDVRMMVSNRLKLGPYFLVELISRFLTETRMKPTLLVLCGRLMQCKRALRQVVQPIDNAGDLERFSVQNPASGERLEIHLIAEEKMEIARTAPHNAASGVRPAGRSVRAAFI